MKILYCGLLYNYGKENEGFSYEHYNIEAGFRNCLDMGIFDHVDFYYPDTVDDSSRDTLLDRIGSNSYDCIFHVAFNETLDLPEKAAKLAISKNIPVIQWDCDSSWRFPHWILPRKDRVTHFVTTHSLTKEWYIKNNMNVISSQWGGSPLYLREQKDKKFDVTFIGQKHGMMPDGKFVRSEIIDLIMSNNIKIDIFGNYWEGYNNWHGYVKDFEKIIDIFAESKICLNLSNPWHYGTMPQIKGRHFEIPQTGSLQICTPAHDLDKYFKNGEEIVVVNNGDELIEKINFYLNNDIEREKIARAGHKRMIENHQWHARLKEIFDQI